MERSWHGGQYGEILRSCLERFEDAGDMSCVPALHTAHGFLDFSSDVANIWNDVCIDVLFGYCRKAAARSGTTFTLPMLPPPNRISGHLCLRCGRSWLGSAYDLAGFAASRWVGRVLPDAVGEDRVVDAIAPAAPGALGPECREELLQVEEAVVRSRATRPPECDGAGDHANGAVDVWDAFEDPLRFVRSAENPPPDFFDAYRRLHPQR